MKEQIRRKCSIVDRKNEWELVFNEEGKKNFLQYGTEDVLRQSISLTARRESA